MFFLLLMQINIKLYFISEAIYIQRSFTIVIFSNIIFLGTRLETSRNNNSLLRYFEIEISCATCPCIQILKLKIKYWVEKGLIRGFRKENSLTLELL